MALCSMPLLYAVFMEAIFLSCLAGKQHVQRFFFYFEDMKSTSLKQASGNNILVPV